MIATVDGRPIVFFLLALGLFGAITIGAMLTVLGRRRRAVWLFPIVPLALTPVLFGETTVSELAAIAACVLAGLALLLPARGLSDEDSGVRAPSTAPLTLVALLGVGAFGFYLLR